MSIMPCSVQELEGEIAALASEVQALKMQKPQMSIKDIINDTDKVSYSLYIKCLMIYLHQRCARLILHFFQLLR